MSIFTSNITIANIGKICRICLQESRQTVPVSSSMEFQEIGLKSITVTETLLKVSSQTTQAISEGNHYPKIICHNCLIDLRSAYLLIWKYEQALKALNAYFSNYEKTTEETEGYEDDSNRSVETETQVPYQTRNAKKRRMVRKQNMLKRGLDKNLVADDESGEKNTAVLHSCPICTKEFTALLLRDHAHTHKALKKYLNIPHEKKVSSTTKFTTRRHLVGDANVSLFNKAEKLHKCPYCYLEFPAMEFRLHIDSHKKECEFKCDKCKRVFKKVNHLNTHRVKHLKEFPYKCEHCGKGFVIKRNYDCHVLTHTVSELPHECRFCLRRFSNPEHLNRHSLIHTENVTYSVKYRVCKCHHCLKTFKDKDELKAHNCVPFEQTSNARYPCKTCKKVFKHSSGLYNHNRNIHKLKGAKVLCSVCGNYVSNIYNHMLRHTGEKPFQCNQCEKRFLAKPQLKQHLLVHSGLKPYVCSSCAKAFNNLYNLQVHERIHKGDRCHICPVCNKGFLEKSYLKKHMHVHAKM